MATTTKTRVEGVENTLNGNRKQLGRFFRDNNPKVASESYFLT